MADPMPPEAFPAQVLLVENSPNDAYFALHAIDASGVPMSRVCVCGDAESAWDYLRVTGQYAGRPAGDPKLVLLDLELPGMRGTQLLELIRADAALQHLPVVVLTGSGTEQDMIVTAKLGVFAYLTKPAGLEETMNILKPCLLQLLNRMPGSK